MLPVITGEIRERGNGALVDIQMRPPALTVAVGLALLAFVACAVCGSSTDGFGPGLLVIAIAYIVATGWFDLEVSSARAFLYDLLKTRETDLGDTASGL
jgi:hypothetical protein